MISSTESKPRTSLYSITNSTSQKLSFEWLHLWTARPFSFCFQREKQQKLNELDVVVVLRLHQIQYMLNSALPQDLSQCLVFNSPALIRLQSRIKELEKEKAEQKRLYRYGMTIAS